MGLLCCNYVVIFCCKVHCSRKKWWLHNPLGPGEVHDGFISLAVSGSPKQVGERWLLAAGLESQSGEANGACMTATVL